MLLGYMLLYFMNTNLGSAHSTGKCEWRSARDNLDNDEKKILNSAPVFLKTIWLCRSESVFESYRLLLQAASVANCKCSCLVNGIPLNQISGAQDRPNISLVSHLLSWFTSLCINLLYFCLEVMLDCYYLLHIILWVL